MDHYNLAERILVNSNLDSNLPALVTQEETLTRQNVQDQVLTVAGNLRALHVAPDDRVLLLLHDSPQFVITFLAIIAMGAIPVPVNPKTGAAGLTHYLTDSRARALIGEPDEVSRLDATIKSSPYINYLIVNGNSGLRMAYSPGLKVFPLAWFFADHGFTPTFSFFRKKPDSICFWQYTSGTTGLPKAVQHVQQTMLSSIKHFANGTLGLSPTDRVYSVAKLFFGYGLGNSLFFPLASGASVYLESGWPTIKRIYDIVSHFSPTVFFGVPKMYGLLSRPVDGWPAAFGQVRIYVSAGSYLTEHLNRKWHELTGCFIIDGIGTTELGHIYVSNRPDQITLGQTGYPVKGYDVRLMSETGQPVAPPELGEMWVKPDFSMAGYWENEAANKQKFNDGWYRTGDIFTQADDGSYRYVGRNDDLFKVNGRWVAPSEIEDLVINSFDVVECAVIGVGDADGVVDPVLFYSSDGDELCHHTLVGLLKLNLESFKVPKHSFRITEFPRNDNGKLLRNELVQLAYQLLPTYANPGCFRVLA